MHSSILMKFYNFQSFTALCFPSLLNKEYDCYFKSSVSVFKSRIIPELKTAYFYLFFNSACNTLFLPFFSLLLWSIHYMGSMSTHIL